MNDFFETNPGRAVLKKRWYQRRGYWLLIILAAIILAVILVFGFKVLRLARQINQGEIVLPSNFTASRSLVQNNSNSIQKVDVDSSDDPSLGSKDALVTIVEFSDFECPHSRQAFPIVQEMLNLYGDKIRFVYRDFPVSDVHDNAEKAAEAARCASDQRKFWLYHDKLFLNQDNLSINDLKSYASDLKLDQDQFNSCLDSGKYEDQVKQDFNDGVLAGVRGTPTWFIDGVKVEGVIPADVFKQIIDQQIQIKQGLKRN